MEFYSLAAIEQIGDPEFQFPTGWNSTYYRRFGCYLCCVSIPNGMEFYTKFQVLLQKAVRFNSQRDGILHSDIIDFVQRSEFQFPTGWNSTNTNDYKDIGSHCFNSQRDGILPFNPGSNSERRNVSIPNGMEFYATRLKFHRLF